MLLLTLTCLLLSVGCIKSDELTEGANVGDYLPNFTLKNQNDQQVNLEGFRGDIVLVEVWASWCGYCNTEAPELNALYEDFKDSGFQIIGLSIDTDHNAWIKKINDHAINYVQVNDPEGFDSKLMNSYNVQAIPKMFLLNEWGQIVLITTKAQGVRDYLSQRN